MGYFSVGLACIQILMTLKIQLTNFNMMKTKSKFNSVCYRIDDQVHDGHISFNYKKVYFMLIIECVLYLLNITSNTQAVSFQLQSLKYLVNDLFIH